MKRYVAACVAVALSATISASTGVGASVARKNSKAEKALIKHVPAPTKSTCEGATAETKKLFNKFFPKNKAHTKDVIAAVNCFPDGVDSVTYMQFTNASDLEATYDALLIDLRVIDDRGNSINLQPNTAPPSDGTCPIEGPYGHGDQENVGRVGCVGSDPSDSEAASDIAWTETALKILSEAFVTNDPDGSQAFAFFGGDGAQPR